jgi:hypothetical protein
MSPYFSRPILLDKILQVVVFKYKHGSATLTKCLCHPDLDHLIDSFLNSGIGRLLSRPSGRGAWTPRVNAKILTTPINIHRDRHPYIEYFDDSSFSGGLTVEPGD